MHLGGDIKRGRPAGRLTMRRRQVLDYAMRCQARGEPVILGKAMRAIGLCDRSAVKRILKDLQQWGFLAGDPRKC